MSPEERENLHRQFWDGQTIPWLEAILGCSVYGSQDSFYTRSPDKRPDLAETRKGIGRNRWFLKYMEFVEKLLVLSRSHLPVGQPITRGVSDMLGALHAECQPV